MADSALRPLISRSLLVAIFVTNRCKSISSCFDYPHWLHHPIDCVQQIGKRRAHLFWKMTVVRQTKLFRCHGLSRGKRKPKIPSGKNLHSSIGEWYSPPPWNCHLRQHIQLFRCRRKKNVGTILVHQIVHCGLTWSIAKFLY